MGDAGISGVSRCEGFLPGAHLKRRRQRGLRYPCSGYAQTPPGLGRSLSLHRSRMAGAEVDIKVLTGRLKALAI